MNVTESPSFKLKISWIVCTLCFLNIKTGNARPTFEDLECKNKIADIVIALDSSGSIWEEDFDREITFVKQIIDHFSIGKDEIQIGVLTFGTTVHTQFNLNDYFFKSDIKQVLTRIQYLGGGTNTGGAIHHAREVMFKTTYGGRDRVDKILIIITDGYSMDSQNTSMEASISHSLGIKMIAVGVGHNIDEFELNYIASRYKDTKMVLKVDEFSKLSTIEDVLTQTACDVMQLDKPNHTDEFILSSSEESQFKNSGGTPAEVYFVIDSSSSMNSIEYSKMLGFVVDVVEMFRIGQNLTRVGVVVYNDGIHPVISLDNAFDKETLCRRIKNIPQYTGGSKTGSALQYVRERGFEHNLVRHNVTYVVIILTDGQSQDMEKTLLESRLLREMGVHIFSIGVGNYVDEHELVQMATEPKQKYVFKMDDLNALSAIKNVPAIDTHKGKEPYGAEQSDISSPMCNSNRTINVMYVYDARALGTKKSHMLFETITNVILSTASDCIKSGILTHACETHTIIPLAAYSSGNHLLEKIFSQQKSALTELLNHLRRKSYNMISNVENSVTNIAVIFIDGNTFPENVNDIQKAALRLKYGRFVDVYIVYVGYNPTTQIQSLCTEPVSDHLVVISNYDHLLDISSQIAEKLHALVNTVGNKMDMSSISRL